MRMCYTVSIPQSDPSVCLWQALRNSNTANYDQCRLISRKPLRTFTAPHLLNWQFFFHWVLADLALCREVRLQDLRGQIDGEQKQIGSSGLSAAVFKLRDCPGRLFKDSDAGRPGHFNRRAGGRQLSGFRVDSKSHYIVAGHIGTQQHRTAF